MLQTLGCSGEENTKSYATGIYLLLDTSGTYTEELYRAKQVINFMLAYLEPGDAFAVARIDSGSFSEKDIIAKVVLDPRPSVANNQKREFANKITQFVDKAQSARYTDISGGILQGVEYLNEADVGSKNILIFSDLKEELPEGYVRKFKLELAGFNVHALNVTKLRSDNQNPQEYLDRLNRWQNQVTQGGGNWSVINDLEKPEALNFKI
ncbi:MAG: VWA domain-containing protein [Cellvibrionaceae bacterium]|nr:VWA domain-containing protein [Cellvibrionaceae bacterium]